MRDLLQRALVFLTLLLAGAGQAVAAPGACTAVEHRAFDFWLGEWTVTRPDTGAEVGRSTITRVASGCAVAEHWRSASGGEGRSLNAYDRQLAAWTQFWVGADGGVLRLVGGLRDGRMVLDGELPTAPGRVQLQRITWTPHEDGQVTQRWETSDDAGKTWNVSFVGSYRRTRAP
jgi:hypothetical protein